MDSMVIVPSGPVSVVGQQRVAWHKLGLVVPDGTTPVEAVRISDTDYRVFTAPMVAQLPSEHAQRYGGFLKARSKRHGRVAIIRDETPDDPTLRILGYASEGYTVLPNQSIADMLMSVADIWPTDTVGCIGQGERFFITLRTGTDEIAGDELINYLIVSNGHTGHTGVEMGLSTRRVVCSNALTAGLKAAALSARIGHTRAVADETRFRLDVIAKVKLAQDRLHTAWSRMAQTALVDQQVDEILAAAYPDPRLTSRMRTLADALEVADDLDATTLEGLHSDDDTYKVAMQRVAVQRGRVKALMEEVGDLNPRIGGTAWALFNAGTQDSDHRPARRGNPAESAMFGERAREKQSLYDAVMNTVLN